RYSSRRAHSFPTRRSSDLRGKNRLTRARQLPRFTISFVAMLGSRLFPGPISSCSPTILQFPAEPTRAVHTLRIMTTQLLQEASLDRKSTRVNSSHQIISYA